MKYKSLALIPARSGSKRIPDKNIKKLGDHPLIAYSIRAAIDSSVFDDVICATDDEVYASIARHYGAEVPFLRPDEISGDKSPDIEWVLWMLKMLSDKGREYDVFSILRPTSPFRLPTTIKRAWDVFLSDPRNDSLRAVEKCNEHPGKMWVIRHNKMLPLLPFAEGGAPWHSSQYAALPEIYVQNASLEFAWTRLPLHEENISGEIIIPFLTEGVEGFDINRPEDWVLAENYIGNNFKLPDIQITPYQI